MQPPEYQERVITKADRVNSTVVTTQAKMLMGDWIFSEIAEKYAISSDWDDRWRTGGRLEDVIEEAHLSPEWIFNRIKRFASDCDIRLNGLRDALDQAQSN
jgi:transketolase